jgi:predicted nucleic acid-binding protein
MIPLRLVVDTNTVVSAALKPEGLQRTVLLLAITIDICINNGIMGA